jgi:hypothetical protein
MFNFFKKQEQEPKNFEEILTSFQDLKKDFKKLSRKVAICQEKYIDSVQKVGMVRFNPFSEVGGDQSFSVALLDGSNNGIVITSLYIREGNRVYGKPVNNGQSKYQLSNEENKAVEKAINNNESKE